MTYVYCYRMCGIHACQHIGLDSTPIWILPVRILKKKTPSLKKKKENKNPV